MATKKAPAKNPVNKLLITAIKKTISKNSALAIMENILLLKNKAVVSDLENYVIIPYESGVTGCIYASKFIDCIEMMGDPKFEAKKVGTKERPEFMVTISEGTRSIKLTGDDPDNYPIIPDMKGAKEIGHFGEQEMEWIKEALCFTSNDDLRPAMTGILCDECIVATDAHRLVWHDLTTPLKRRFILPSKAANILLALGGEWTLSTKEEYETDKAPQLKDVSWVCFKRSDGVKVITRAIDARYPDYKVVVPDVKEAILTLSIEKDVFMKEIKNASKFANRSTKQVAFHVNGKIDVHSHDVDFGEEYKNVLPGTIEFSDEHAVYKIAVKEFDEMEGKPVVIRKELEDGVCEVQAVFGDKRQKAKKVWLEKINPTMDIAFNGEFLQEFLQKQPDDKPVEVKLFSPTKAGIINNNYLVMPLMLNS